MLKTSPQTDGLKLLDELLESDAAYFLAAAECEELHGFRISYMPGLESLAAACVVHKIARESVGDQTQWLPVLEKRISALGCHHSRFYQQGPDTEMEKQFFQNDYRPAEEIALLNTFSNVPPGQDGAALTELRPVRSEQDWSLKLALHHDIPQGPDGHVADAETWVTMERRKCEAGYMEPFLIVQGDHVCGAVNFASGPRIGRLKNIVIHPHWRRKGMGVQGARLIARLAQERGKTAAGCFALKDGQAVQMYQDAGYLPVTRQTEWYKKLQ